MRPCQGRDRGFESRRPRQVWYVSLQVYRGELQIYRDEYRATRKQGHQEAIPDALCVIAMIVQATPPDIHWTLSPRAATLILWRAASMLLRAASMACAHQNTSIPSDKTMFAF